MSFVVDTDAHNLPLPPDLEPYLPERWREYLGLIGLRTPAEFGLVRSRWMASRTDAWSPSGKPPGNDPAYFREQLLDAFDIDIAILNSLAMVLQTYIGGNQPPAFSAALLRAANEWAVEHWLDFDERLYSSICVPFEDAELAVAEIERWATHPRFVQVSMPFRSQKPYGHYKYWPVYEAATHYDLPIGLHPGSIGNNLITGAGWPSFYFEDHVGLPQALFAQLASLVCEGVFDRFPTLKIVLQEGGWSWVAPYAWRFDRAWRQLRAEVPHVERPPSEYIREHIWYTSQPIEEPERPEQFLAAFERAGVADRLMFSSDYPHWDFDAPDQALPTVLSEDVRRRIFSENALALYRLPKPALAA